MCDVFPEMGKHLVMLYLASPRSSAFPMRDDVFYILRANENQLLYGETLRGNDLQGHDGCTH